MNNGTETGRNPEWLMETVFTTVALISLLNSYDGAFSDQEQQLQRAFYLMCVTLSLSAIADAGNLFMREKFIGSVLEGVLLVGTTALWAAMLPPIMDPYNSLAVRPITGSVLNANLYFFSWGGFVMSYVALNSYAKEMRGLVEDILYSSTMDVLAMTSMVLMISAVRLFQAKECGTDNPIDGMEEMCSRISFAIALGNVSSIICFAWFLMLWIMDYEAWMVYVEAAASVVLLTMWSFAVGYITFGGENVPVDSLSNVYFFTVGSFALSVVLFSECLNNFMNRDNNTDNTRAQHESDPAVDAEKKQDQGLGGVLAYINPLASSSSDSSESS